MDPIVWSENFSVGVKTLDKQHKQLISILNKTLNAPTLTTASETVSDILTEMTQYAREHFRYEEKLMIEHGFPEFEQHKKSHIAFSDKVAKLSLATMENLDDVPQELMDYLFQWLQQHILHEDMKYKAFFKTKI